MAHDKLNLTGQRYINVDKNVPVALFNLDYEQKNLYRNSNSGTGRFFRLIRGLFNLFNHHETNIDIVTTNEELTENKIVREQHNDEQSLRDLENCANAARKSEAGGQYEWD